MLFLIVTFGGLALLAGTGRSRREQFFRRREEQRFEQQLHGATKTDATGMLTCRRCGAEAHESAGACPRCGAFL